MISRWTTKRVLITVRTYPAPAHKGIEVSCTAAVTSDGHWVRLFPVPYRFLPPDKRFAKYQWIDVDLCRAPGDHRPESHHLNADTIKLGQLVSSANNWAARKAILKPLMRPSHCAMRRELEERGQPTLGLFKPRRIKRLIIETGEPDWSTRERAILSQKQFGFQNAPRDELEKIPFDFYYDFECGESGCKGHKLSCTDWEMAESYRSWRRQYGDRWVAKFREKYEQGMVEKFDTHFYVGTLHQHPKNWIIVGLFYPPVAKIGDLFDR